MADQLPARRDPRSFTQFLDTIEDGAFVAELEEALASLVTTIQQRAAAGAAKPKGKLQIAIEFRLDRGVFEVDAEVALKLPKPVRGRSFLYGLPDGSLSPQNPSQLDAFRDVSTPAAADARVVALR